MRRSTIQNIFVLAASFALLMSAAACGQNDNPAIDRTTEPPGDETRGAQPGLKISSPSDGETVPPGDVTVRADVTNFDLVAKLGQPAVSGQGHIHFYIDVDELPTQAGRPAVTSDASTYHAAKETTHTWSNVPAGEHTFAAQLVNNDHTPLQPPVTASVKAMVG